MIKLKLFHYNYNYLVFFKNYILKILILQNCKVKNQFLKKIKLNNITLLKSPHVDKKAQENFGVTYYTYSLVVFNSFKNKNLSFIKYFTYILKRSNCFFKFYF